MSQRGRCQNVEEGLEFGQVLQRQKVGWIRHNGLNRFTIWLALLNSKNASHRMSSCKLYAMTIKDLIHGRLAAFVNSAAAVRM